MNFSSILDISSFFIGMIINLLLVALVSYYFKRKYEHLEKSINEHSEHIYLLLKKERDTLCSLNTTSNICMVPSSLSQNKNYPSVANSNSSSNNSSSNDDSDDSDDSSDSDEDMSDNETVDETQNNSDVDEIEELDVDVEDVPSNDEAQIVVEELHETENKNETKHFTIQQVKPEETTTTFNVHKIDTLPQEYNKLTMKQLKDLLSNKGISVKPNMKKNDLIDLASKNSIEIENDMKNPSHISIADCDLDLTNLNDEVTTLVDSGISV